mmetsp:Transcript_5001/g.13290  ORF Transcript_5001/g.13290 Transcript_5001/m.13290 type:complete len:332 (+) Transcript_5001:1930-2925(+)
MILEPRRCTVERIHDMADHEAVAFLRLQLAGGPFLNVTVTIVGIVGGSDSVLGRLLQQGMVASEDFMVRLVLALEEFTQGVPLTEVDDEWSVGQILAHVADVQRIDGVEEVPSLEAAERDVGCHETPGHLMRQLEMCRRHGVAVHFRHEDWCEIEDSRCELRPVQGDVVHVASRGHVGWSGGVETGRILHRQRVDWRIISHNMLQILLDAGKPALSESINLRDWLALLHLRVNDAGIFLKVSRPCIQGNVAEVIDDRPLQEHVWIHQNDNVVIGICVHSFWGVAKDVFQPMSDSEWLRATAMMMVAMVTSFAVAVISKPQAWCVVYGVICK